MSRFLRVPWISWQRFRVRGVVRERESGKPLAGLVVRGFDKDVIRDDYLGEAQTDAAGRFEIRFRDAAFKDFLESKPDIFLCVFAPGTLEPIHDTSFELRKDAGPDEHFEIEIPRARLPASFP